MGAKRNGFGIICFGILVLILIGSYFCTFISKLNNLDIINSRFTPIVAILVVVIAIELMILIESLLKKTKGLSTSSDRKKLWMVSSIIGAVAFVAARVIYWVVFDPLKINDLISRSFVNGKGQRFVSNYNAQDMFSTLLSLVCSIVGNKAVSVYILQMILSGIGAAFAFFAIKRMVGAFEACLSLWGMAFFTMMFNEGAVSGQIIFHFALFMIGLWAVSWLSKIIDRDYIREAAIIPIALVLGLISVYDTMMLVLLILVMVVIFADSNAEIKVKLIDCVNAFLAFGVGFLIPNVIDYKPRGNKSMDYFVSRLIDSKLTVRTDYTNIFDNMCDISLIALIVLAFIYLITFLRTEEDNAHEFVIVLAATVLMMFRYAVVGAHYSMIIAGCMLIVLTASGIHKLIFISMVEGRRDINSPDSFGNILDDDSDQPSVSAVPEPVKDDRSDQTVSDHPHRSSEWDDISVREEEVPLMDVTSILAANKDKELGELPDDNKHYDLEIHDLTPTGNGITDNGNLDKITEEEAKTEVSPLDAYIASHIVDSQSDNESFRGSNYDDLMDVNWNRDYVSESLDSFIGKVADTEGDTAAYADTDQEWASVDNPIADKVSDNAVVDKVSDNTSGVTVNPSVVSGDVASDVVDEDVIANVADETFAGDVVINEALDTDSTVGENVAADSTVGENVAADSTAGDEAVTDPTTEETVSKEESSEEPSTYKPIMPYYYRGEYKTAIISKKEDNAEADDQSSESKPSEEVSTQEENKKFEDKTETSNAETSVADETTPSAESNKSGRKKGGFLPKFGKSKASKANSDKSEEVKDSEQADKQTEQRNKDEYFDIEDLDKWINHYDIDVDEDDYNYDYE